MITPSFSLTATERVLPKLALDFTTGSLDSRVTFTRATSASNPATYTDASGNLVLATNDQPRFDYKNGVCQGLLIEESRTNINGNGAWSGAATGSPGTAPTNWFFSRTGGSIDTIAVGSLSENILTFSATTNRQVISLNTATTANTTYSGSVYVHSNTGLPFNQIFNAQFFPAGTTVTLFANGVSVTGTYVPVAGDRLTAVAAVAVTTGNITWQAGLGILSNVTGTITLSKVQLEAGTFATSYIPTTSTALTRNADVAVMTGTNFSDWFNASEGTFSVTLQSLPNSGASDARAVCVNDNTASSSYIFAWVASTTQMRSRLFTGAATQFQFLYTTDPTAENTIAVGYKVNDFAGALEGGAVSTDTSGTLASPTPTQLVLTGDGTGTTSQYKGHLKKVFYWPSRLTNAQVQAFSKG